MLIIKNRNKKPPTFANINLLGKCNADCFFCLGKDIPELLTQHNQLNTHYTKWKNFDAFLDSCKGIEKLYITGQNTDSLQYKYLDSLVEYLQVYKNFNVGLRSNGILIEENIETINKCQNNRRD